MTIKWFLRPIGFLLLILSTSAALGIEQNTFILESPRSLGRGGARVAAFDSDEAIRINPATLDESDISFQLRWLDLDIMIGENTLDTISDLVSLLSSDKVGVSSLDKFSEKFGETQFGRAQMSLFGMRLGFIEVSTFSSNTAKFKMDTSILPEVSWLNDLVAGLNIGMGYSLTPTLSLGATIRPIYRLYIAGSMPTDLFMDLAAQKTTFDKISPLRTGTGFGLDLGTIWKPIPGHRLALVFYNVGDTAISGKKGKEPPNIRQNISIGYMFRMDLYGGNIDFYTDLQDIENRNGLPLLRLLHSGVEWGIPVFTRDHDYGISTGLNEGFITAGLFADLYLVRFDLTHYTVGTGHSIGQLADKRWAFTARSAMTF